MPDIFDEVASEQEASKKNDIFSKLAKEKDIFDKVAFEDKKESYNVTSKKKDIFDELSSEGKKTDKLTDYQQQVVSNLRQEGLEDWRLEKLTEKMEKYPDIYESPESQTDTNRRIQEIELSNIRHVKEDTGPLVDPEKLVKAFHRGGKRALIPRLKNILEGKKSKTNPESMGFLEELSQSAGKLLVDSPFMIAGAKLGAMAGTAVSPGAGTAIGSAAGMFGLPGTLESILDEYEDYGEKGGKKSFGEFVKMGGRILKGGAKSALLGAAMGTIGKFMPYLSKIPAFNKLLNLKYGQNIAKVGADMAAYSGIEKVFEGEAPSMRDLGLFGALAVGFHALESGKEALRKYGERPLVKPESVTKKPDIKAEKIDRILEKKPKVEAKPKEKVIEVPKFKDIPAKPKEQKDTGSTVEALKKLVPEPVKKLAREYKKRSAVVDKVKDILGERDVAHIDAYERTKVGYEKSVKEHGREFTTKEHQDMYAYAQKTGNPNIKGDTFNDVKARSPKAAKDYIDNVARKRFNEIRTEVNADPLMKNITPREGLAEIYLPGSYEGTPKEIRKAYRKVYARLKERNPHADMKTFLTYHDAMKAELKPKYKTIPELLDHYESNIIKSKLASKIINEAKNNTDVSGNKLVNVQENSQEAYSFVKSEGYVPFWDEALRTYKDENGNIKVSSRPAMVEPVYGSIIDNIFSQDAPKSSKFWTEPLGQMGKTYDAANKAWKIFQVAFSPFHYKTQFTNLAGILPATKGVLRPIHVMTKGAELLEDVAFRKRSAMARAMYEPIESLQVSKDVKIADRAIDFLSNPEGKTNAQLKWANNTIKKSATALHKIFIPRLKAYSFNELASIEAAKFEKANGRKLTPSESKALDRMVATHVNNVFGTLDYESNVIFKNKTLRKWIGRVQGYPGWTISNLRQAFSALKPGLPGKMGRTAVKRMAFTLATLAGSARLAFDGIQQDENRRPYFDPVKALQGLLDVQSPDDFFSFTLPAIDYKLASGKILRLGRNSDGTRIKLGLGKQLTEVPKMFLTGVTGFVETLFNKSAPPVRALWQQLIGHTPSAGQKTLLYPVRAKYEGGKTIPWKGKKGLIAQLPERAMALGESIKPFGLGSLIDDGPLKWIQTGFGTFSSKKEITLAREEDNMRSALRNKNVSQRTKLLDNIEKKLKRNDFTQKEIDGRMSQVKGFVKKDRYSERVRGALMMADENKREMHTSELRQEMREDNLNFTELSIDSLFNSELKSLAYEGFMTKAEAEKFKTFKLRDTIKSSIESGDKNELNKIKKNMQSAGRTKKKTEEYVKNVKDEVIRKKYNDRIYNALSSRNSKELGNIIKEMRADKIGITPKIIKSRITVAKKKFRQERIDKLKKQR